VRRILTDTAEPVLGTCEEGHGLVDARTALGHERADEGGSVVAGGVGSIIENIVSGLEWIANQIAAVLEWFLGLFR